MKLSRFRERFDAFQRQRSPALALKIFQELASNCRFTARKFEAGYHVYRSVKWAHLHNNQERLSYPPLGKAALGRCNLDNQQVFYASHHPANTFAEQKNLKVGDKFAIGKWRITPELYAVLVGFTIDEEQSISSNPSYVGLSSTDRHAHSKFRKYFKYRGPKYYPQTATISNYLMSLEYPTDFGQLNAGSKTVLAYASVEFPNKETLAINFAFPKNFVDQHLTLVAADYVEIREVSDLGVKYNVLQSANRVAEDGILNWSEQQQWEVQNNQTVKAEVTSEYKWRVTDAVTGEEVPATPIPKEINYFGKSTQDTPHVVQYDWDQLKKEW